MPRVTDKSLWARKEKRKKEKVDEQTSEVQKSLKEYVWSEESWFILVHKPIIRLTHNLFGEFSPWVQDT